MKAPQEGVESIRRRPRPPDQPKQPSVAGQDLHIFDALASRGLDEDDGMEFVELGKAPLAATKSQPAPGNLIQAKG